MTKTKSNILVTGGAGFIGSHLVPLLLRKGYSVTVLDNLSSGKIENLNKARDNSHFTLIRGDIRDENDLHYAFRDVDVIVHLAALIDISTSVANPTQTNDVNVTGTLRVLQESTKTKMRRLIFASSTAIYGDAKTLPVREDTVPNPISPYAASKAAAENYLTSFHECYGLETVALRFFNVYGPQNGNNPYSGVITKFLWRAANNEALTVDGDGEQTRDFVYVDDVANALMLALEAENVAGEKFNICTGTPTSINQLAKTILEVTGKKLQIKYGSPRSGDIRHSYGDPGKASKKLKFTAKTPLKDGLTKLLRIQKP